jgi:hypothetical protein
MSTTQMMDQAIALGGNLWTGNNGSERVYLNDWQDLAGADVDYAKSGKLRGFAWDGEYLSNAQGSEIMAVKAYVDASGLHFTFNREPRADETFEAMQSALLATITEQEV